MHVENDRMDDVMDIPQYKFSSFDFSLAVIARLNP